ncbi:MAG: type II secretion system F family protein [Nitrososphaerota archaeon]|nr:type II secretion system F family protein [Nitrososphaerota archaeon]
MPRVSKEIERRILIASLIIALSILSLTFIPDLRLPLDRDSIIVIAISVALFPPGFTYLLNVIWRRGIDRNIPKMLRAIYEVGRVGMSIPQAIARASEQDLGPLTKELRRMVTQMSWGMTIDEAVEDIIKRTDTPLSRRAFRLILTAYKTGGDVEEMLSALHKYLSEMQITFQERMALMRPYIGYMYITFFIFLAISVMLLKSFFAPMMAVHETYRELGGLIQFGLDLPTTTRLFFHMCIIQAFIGGLVAGKMGEGSIMAGLKHVVALLISCVIVFYLFIWR